jgi:hypothetical protein
MIVISQPNTPFGIVAEGCSTSATLTASQQFTGSWVDCINYGQVAYSIQSDVTSSTGGIIRQWSQDQVNIMTWSADSLNADRTGTTNGTDITVRVHARYFRIIYINGLAPQGYFRLQTFLQQSPPMGDTIGIAHNLDDGDDALITKSIIAGRSAAVTSTYVDAQILDHDNMGGFNTPGLAVRNILDRYTLTAFDEARVSTPLTILNLVNRYGLDTRLIATSATLSASVSALTGTSSIKVFVSSSASTIAELSTRRYFRYQAGHGTRWLMSVVHENTGTAGQNRSWGYFDDNNGVYFRLTGTTLGVAQRSNTSGAPVDLFVSQSLWNIDKMNGQGPSRINLDLTKGNIYECDFQWLGVGNVVYFVDGHPVHEFVNVNSGTSPYMATAVLPIRARVHNTTGTATGSLQLICAQVSVENGQAPSGWSFCAEGGYTTSGTTEVPVITLAMTSTFNGVDNRGRIRPTQVNLLTSGGQPGIFRLRSNYSPAGASFGTVDPTSIANIDTTAQSGTGGVLIGGPYYVAAGAGAVIDLSNVFPDAAEGIRRLNRDPYTGVSDNVTVTVQRIGGGNVSCNVGVSWLEEL